VAVHGDGVGGIHNFSNNGQNLELDLGLVGVVLEHMDA